MERFLSSISHRPIRVMQVHHQLTYPRDRCATACTSPDSIPPRRRWSLLRHRHRNEASSASLNILLLIIFATTNVAFADDPLAEIATQKPADKQPADKQAPKQKLIERRPFDVVVLSKAAGGSTLEVQTIGLPQRPPS